MSQETHSEIIRELESVRKDLKTLKVISACILIMIFLFQIQNLVSSFNRVDSSHDKFDTQNNQFIQERWIEVFIESISRGIYPAIWERVFWRVWVVGILWDGNTPPLLRDRKHTLFGLDGNIIF